MSNLSGRLIRLERKSKRPAMMLGSMEVHCVGGWQKLDGGLECHEHENCAYSFTPVLGALRRLIMIDWEEGMGNPFAPQ